MSVCVCQSIRARMLRKRACRGVRPEECSHVTKKSVSRRVQIRVLACYEKAHRPGADRPGAFGHDRRPGADTTGRGGTPGADRPGADHESTSRRRRRFMRRRRLGCFQPWRLRPVIKKIPPWCLRLPTGHARPPVPLLRHATSSGER